MSDGEEEEELSIHDKQKIAKKLIVSAPVAQLGLIVKDLTTLCGKDVITDDFVEDACKSALESKFSYSKDDKTILCSLSKEGKGYKNPKKGTVSTFSSFKNLKPESEKLNEEIPSLNTEVEKSLEKMSTSYYQKLANAEYATGVYSTDNGLNVVISADNISLRNYWSGTWVSVHKVDTDKGTVEGSITIQVHYFEEGNVQLNTKFNKTEDIKLSGGDDKKSRQYCKSHN